MFPKKVLLAEDDADDREIFFDFLRNRHDISLLAALENGEEVLDFLSQTKEAEQLPDFIILDQNMPKKNGIQTLQSLKTGNGFENIPVFIYSTYADQVLQRQSTEAGAVSVFSKPHTGGGYQEMIDAMLHAIEPSM